MILRNWATNGHTGAVERFVFRKPCTNGIREERASKTVTLSVHLWLRFGALWFAVVLIGFIEGLRSLALWSRNLPWRRFSHRDCSLAHCTEVATLTG